MSKYYGILEPDEHKFHIHVSESDLSIRMNGLAIDINWIAKLPNDTVWKYSKHKHAGFEFHFITEGECSIWLDGGEPFLIRAGQFFIIPPEVQHAQQSNPENRAVEYSLNCQISMDQDQSEEWPEEWTIVQWLQNKEGMLVAEDQFDVITYFEHIFQEDHLRPIGHRAMMESLVYQIVLHAIRAIADQQGIPRKVNPSDIIQERMEEIDAIIDEHISGNLTLRMVSDSMFLSEKQIGRTVSQVRKMSFHQYVMVKRCEKAMVYLSDPVRKVQEVADLLGFSSSHHFSRAFQKQFGLLPSEYQKIHAQKKEASQDV